MTTPNWVCRMVQRFAAFLGFESPPSFMKYPIKGKTYDDEFKPSKISFSFIGMLRHPVYGVTSEALDDFPQIRMLVPWYYNQVHYDFKTELTYFTLWPLVPFVAAGFWYIKYR